MNKTLQQNQTQILVAALIIIILVAVIIIIRAAIKKRKDRLRGLIARENGIGFENDLEQLFYDMGYEVWRTQDSRDYGADLLVYTEDTSFAVQAKLLNHNVGLDAVQQAFTASYYYETENSVVISATPFTKPAITLAEKVGTILIYAETFEGLREEISELM